MADRYAFEDTPFLSFAWSWLGRCDRSIELVIERYGFEYPQDSDPTAAELSALDDMLMHYDSELQRQLSVLSELHEERELPRDEKLLLTSIYEALHAYFGVGSGYMRRLDSASGSSTWGGQVARVLRWHFALPVDRPEIHGTTNSEQIRALRAEYTHLVLLNPCWSYEVARDGEGCWAYAFADEDLEWFREHVQPPRTATGPATVRTDHDERWDETLRSELLEGYVVGPFAYSTKAAALAAQERRLG
jgi:hypothetical protein